MNFVSTLNNGAVRWRRLRCAALKRCKHEKGTHGYSRHDETITAKKQNEYSDQSAKSPHQKVIGEMSALSRFLRKPGFGLHGARVVTLLSN